ncbi:MAG: phosphatidate cytidylyltransferase [Anaerolineae bacterium]|nr:phosphatidate cytidylyltransferase [Anaerolineae bacterium]
MHNNLMTGSPTADANRSTAAPGAAWSDLRKRLLTITVGLPLVMLIVFAGGLPMLIGVLVVAVLVAAEIARMIEPDTPANLWLAVPAAALALLAIAGEQLLLFLPAAALILVPGAVRALRAPARRWQHFSDYTLHLLAGTLYAAVPLGMLVLIREHSGVAWTVFLLFTTWSTDSWALIGGRLWGRHKLAPTISPGKTTEGALVGYVAGVVMALIIMLAAQLPGGVALPAAVLLPALVIAGDLVESWMKRYFAVKDSGSLLPGHGGFFDRADGLILATPVLFFLLMRGIMI